MKVLLVIVTLQSIFNLGLIKGVGSLYFSDTTHYSRMVQDALKVHIFYFYVKCNCSNLCFNANYTKYDY
jgi:hypothetical protein